MSRFRWVITPLKAEGIFVRDATGIRLRHRILSEYAWSESVSEDERYHAMSTVVSVLAPQINAAVIKSKGIAHLIVREILDQENVSQSIGRRALEFYEQHESLMGWSSRYWDQRALLESTIEGHFSKAYSYSQKAISLEQHPFAYTSLGAICMTRATRLIKHERLEAMKFFYEGEEALTAAWKAATDLGRPYEHPFVKFFASAIFMFRHLRPSDTEFAAVLQYFRLWIQRAKDSPAFSTFYGQRRIKAMEAVELKETLRNRRGNEGVVVKRN